MEIKFNPSQAVQNGANQPVSRRDAAPVAEDKASLDKAGALEQQLREIPLVRPEKVERARALVADVQYPPEEMLDRIASLLALHA
jgi:hypothetical protein